MALEAPNSEVAVCNLALDLLKQAPIAQLDPPTSGVEEQCARWYHQVRRATLRSHPWNFATKRYSLTPAAAAPEFGYTHAYNLPNDFLRLCVLLTDDDIRIGKDEYEIEDGQVLYDGEDNGTLYLLYVRDHNTVDDFDPMFLQLFVLNLAVALGPKFQGTEARVRTLIEQARDYATEAKAVDGQERPPRRVQSSTWADVRRFGRSRRSTRGGTRTVFE